MSAFDPFRTLEQQRYPPPNIQLRIETQVKCLALVLQQFVDFKTNFGKVVEQRRIVALALLTQPELDQLGQALARVWPLQEGTSFEGLIEAIDAADNELREERTMPL